MKFTIPKPTPSNNEIKGMHRMVYKKLREEFAWLVKVNANIPEKPIKKCRIMFTRYSSGQLDWSNLYGGFKVLEDCLVVSTTRNPSGLSIIEDDNPNVVLSLSGRQEKCKRGEGKTEVWIVEC